MTTNEPNLENQVETFATNFVPLYQAIQWLSTKTGRQWTPRDLLGVLGFAAGKPHPNSPIRVIISNGSDIEIEKIIPFGLAWLEKDEICQLLDMNQTVATYGYHNEYKVFEVTNDDEERLCTQYQTFLNPVSIDITDVMIPRQHLEFILNGKYYGWPITLKPYTVPSHATTSSKKPINEIRIPIIINTIYSLGGDPLNTSANSGISGIKKKVREKLKGHPDFVSDKAFNNAWQAARDESKIK